MEVINISSPYFIRRSSRKSNGSVFSDATMHISEWVLHFFRNLLFLLFFVLEVGISANRRTAVILAVLKLRWNTPFIGDHMNCFVYAWMRVMRVMRINKTNGVINSGRCVSSCLKHTKNNLSCPVFALMPSNHTFVLWILSFTAWLVLSQRCNNYSACYTRNQMVWRQTAYHLSACMHLSRIQYYWTLDREQLVK